LEIKNMKNKFIPIFDALEQKLSLSGLTPDFIQAPINIDPNDPAEVTMGGVDLDGPYEIYDPTTPTQGGVD
jgi:hypothetical protein